MKSQFVSFETADADPLCLLGKYQEIIKLDFLEKV
jgi:hypothetical protein